MKSTTDDNLWLVTYERILHGDKTETDTNKVLTQDYLLLLAGVIGGEAI